MQKTQKIKNSPTPAISTRKAKQSKNGKGQKIQEV